MKPIVFAAKSAVAEIREACRDAHEEDGGMLFGRGEHGDVLAQIRAPADAERSTVIIKLNADAFEQRSRQLMKRVPGSAWVGAWHLHLGLRELSSGDREQLLQWHDDPRVPRSGITKLLAVRHRTGRFELRGWVSPQKGVVVEVDVFEVDDVDEARYRLGRSVRPTPVRPHALGTGPAAERFERELEALATEGYAIEARVTPQGVEVLLRHGDLSGALSLVVPAEGWERPPRIEHRVEGASRLITSPLASLLAAWSSAFSLADVVAQARSRNAWPRVSLLKRTVRKKGVAA